MNEITHPEPSYELYHLIDMMEKMAGAPREDGTYERQPGERNMYELSNERRYKEKLDK